MLKHDFGDKIHGAVNHLYIDYSRTFNHVDYSFILDWSSNVGIFETDKLEINGKIA